MENRANYVLIGSFVLVVVLALFGFVIWLAKLQVDREFTNYTIYFEGSVAGLSTASNVLYNGIPVGTVQSIVIDPLNPQRVRVVVEVASDTPVKRDSVAQLQLQGITGVSLVALTGGSADSAPLTEAPPGEKYPVIDSRPSQFQRLFEGAPDLIARAVELLDQTQKLVSDENVVALSAIITDVQTLSSELAGRSDDIGAILDDVQGTSAEMRRAAESLNGLVTSLDAQVQTLSDSADATLAVVRGAVSNADTVVDRDLRALISELRGTAASITEVSEGLSAMVEDMRLPLADFSAEGLYEFSGLITDMRQLTASLARLAGQFEADPAQFLFGDQRGFEAE